MAERNEALFKPGCMCLADACDPRLCHTEDLTARLIWWGDEPVKLQCPDCGEDWEPAE